MSTPAAWHRLVAVLGAAAGDLQLRPPASEAALAGAETLFERALPASYRALLAIADGQEPGGLSLFPSGSWLLSIREVVEAWLAAAKHVVREWDDEPVRADARVRPVVWHPTRIPFTADAVGTHELLDLWPGPRGTVGQVIAFVSEHEFAVLGDNLDDYFARLATLIATHKIRRDGDCFVRSDTSFLELVERR